MKTQIIACWMALVLCAGTTFGGLAGIAVNEILPDPNVGAGPGGFDTDGDGTSENSDEFIEFANTTGSSVDISGWQLYVEGATSHSLRYTFPTTTSIPAGGFLALVSNWDPGSPPSNFLEVGTGAGSILGNNGDNFVVLDPSTLDYASWVYNGHAHNSAGLPAGATNVMMVDLGDDADAFGISASPDYQETTYLNDITPTPGMANVPEPSAFLLLNAMVLFGAWKSWTNKRVSFA